MVPWQQIIQSGASLAGNLANWQGARRASAQQEQNLKRAQAIQQRNLLMNLGMYEPNRALGYGAQSDLATLYGYTLPDYLSSQALAATTNSIGPKMIKQYLKMGMSLEDISKIGTLATPNAKQLKKLRKAGLTADQIKALMTPAQQDYAGPLQGGTGEAGQPSAGNMSRFFTSPDYQFRLDQGTTNLKNAYAGGGQGLLSGNAMRGITAYGQGLAANEYDSYVRRLFDMAGIGERAQGQVSQVGTNTANQRSNYQAQIGDAESAGILGQYGAVAQHMADLANIWGGGKIMGGQNASGVSGGSGGLTQGQMSGDQLMPVFGQSGFGSNVAGGIGSYFSDVRVKTDLERVGRTPGGHNLYQFRYVWDPETVHVGVLAQEVEQIDPEAVSEVDGIKCVDYRRIQ